jgi:hypothetical protein
MRSLDLKACAILSVLASTAQAAEDGFYIGAASGESKTRHEGGLGDVFDDEDSAFKLMGGWRPVDWFAIEASYFDLGAVTLRQAVPGLSPFRLEQDGYDVFGVFFVDIINFDLFAKAGAVRSSADLTTGTIAGQASSVDNDSDFAWGVGAQLRFRKLAARVEYERRDISNGSNFKTPTMVSVGITWTF